MEKKKLLKRSVRKKVPIISTLRSKLLNTVGEIRNGYKTNALGSIRAIVRGIGVAKGAMYHACDEL